MCDLLKISGMRDEIFYLRKEIDICKCRLLLLNETTVIPEIAEVLIINKSIMQSLIDEISILKDMRLLMLSHLYQEEYNSIQLNANICDRVKQILIEMITHLYVPYNMHRETEIRERFLRFILPQENSPTKRSAFGMYN